MSNYMAGVAKLLGVEVGEVFEVYIDNEHQGRCRFTKDRVEISDNHCWYRTKAETLEWLLNGTATIIKLPWKPAKMETYYVPCVSEVCRCDRFTWFDDSNDHFRLRHGLVFKTRDEAVAMTNKMLKLAEKTQAQEANDNE